MQSKTKKLDIRKLLFEQCTEDYFILKKTGLIKMVSEVLSFDLPKWSISSTLKNHNSNITRAIPYISPADPVSESNSNFHFHLGQIEYL